MITSDETTAMMDTEFLEFNFLSGNITIKIKKNDKIGIGMVSSKAMISASPIWEHFIFPPWFKPEDPPVPMIDFTEDDADALLILLQIEHNCFVYVPNITVNLVTTM